MKTRRRSALPAPCLALALACASIDPASADALLPSLGGFLAPIDPQFTARCAADQQVAGFGMRTGDDVNAIWPLCVTAFGPNRVGPQVPVPAPGGRGEQVNRLVCPRDKPVVVGLAVKWEGRDTYVINAVEIQCGVVAAQQGPASGYPDARFEAPAYQGPGRTHGKASQRCPYGMVAVGIHGHAGNWVEKLGLICAGPVITASQSAPRAPLDLKARMPAAPDGALTAILVEWSTPDQSQLRPVDSYTVERQSPPGPDRPWIAEGSLTGPKGEQSGRARLAFQFKSAPLDPRHKHAFRVCAINGSGSTCAAPVVAAVAGKTAADARAPHERAFRLPDRTDRAAPAAKWSAPDAPPPVPPRPQGAAPRPPSAAPDTKVPASALRVTP